MLVTDDDRRQLNSSEILLGRSTSLDSWANAPPTSSERPSRRVESQRLSRGTLMSTQRWNRDDPLRGPARCRCEGPHTDSGHRGAASTRSPILTRHCSYPYGVDHIEAAAWHDAGRARHHLVERLSGTYRQSAIAPLLRITDLFNRSRDVARRAHPARRRLAVPSGDSGCPGVAAGICAMACSASAVIVNAGFTPGFAGIAAPSHTSRFR